MAGAPATGRRRSGTHSPGPESPDPFEIAYLRGGQNEVTRLVVFDLLRRAATCGSSEASRRKGRTGSKIQQAAGHPPEGQSLAGGGGSPSTTFRPRGARDAASGGMGWRSRSATIGESSISPQRATPPPPPAVASGLDLARRGLMILGLRRLQARRRPGQGPAQRRVPDRLRPSSA